MVVFGETLGLLLPGWWLGNQLSGCCTVNDGVDLSAEPRSKCDLSSRAGEPDVASLVVILDQTSRRLRVDES